jgi:DNA primase
VGKKVIDQDAVAEIRRRVRLDELAREHLALKKSGNDYVALCPFHQESNPSFHIHTKTNRYKCFGCGAAGDMIDFAMKIGGADFVGTVEKLAERAGVHLPDKDEMQHVPDSLRRLYGIHEEAEKFFIGATNEKVSEYAKEREIGEKAAQSFGIGRAPDAWHDLQQHLRSLGYTGDEMLRSGLIVKQEGKDNTYDRFRNRLMFPIRDSRGRTVGFSGRAVDEAEKGAKYINSPATEIFSKSCLLFGLDLAIPDIRKTGRALVVEGQMDCVSMHSAGYRNAVAPMGTAFTADHCGILSRFAQTVVFIFDGDNAGRQAASEIASITALHEIDARVALLPEKTDPDELVRKGVDLLEFVDDATDALHFWYSCKQKEFPKTPAPADVAALASAFLDLVSEFKDPLLRSLYLGFLAERTSIPYATLTEELASRREGEKNNGSGP